MIEPLQTTLPAIPEGSGAVLGMVLLAFIGGMTVPTRYGIERLNGFGRAVASKIPYEPPADQQARQQEAQKEQAEQQQPEQQMEETNA